ncbi:MAG: DUF1501 domain-containing protein [Planctomycetia bacterium]|nr:DUF1501 domain-containing protein [Planctomycetia bacterium]
MLRINGRAARACDGFTRRDILEIGGLGALGVMLPELLGVRRARAATSSTSATAAPRRATPGKAQACILVYLFGGPSQIDTFDMKPDAPADFRGEFQAIDTNVPGVQICEHFPLLARQVDKLAIVRSMNHLHPRHGYGLYYMFTGREHARPDLDAAPSADDFPSMGAVVSRVQGARADFPPAVTLPRWNRFLDLPNEYAGEVAGFLGKTFDPWLVKADKSGTQFNVSGIELADGVTLERLAARRSLLSSFNGELARLGNRAELDQLDVLYRQAFSIVTSAEARRAFDLEEEPAGLRDRYGRQPFGQGMLLARRLVEAGATLVSVNWHDDGRDVKSPFWDTHKDNFTTLKNVLMPPLDRALSALLSDLDERGLLESTLVVVMGEFGRTPRIGRVVMNTATNKSGRDHWPHAYSVLLAGGGVRGGQVYGASDPLAAFVKDRGVTPPDLVATVLYALGIDPRERIVDRQGRPHPLATGRPVVELM